MSTKKGNQAKKLYETDDVYDDFVEDYDDKCMSYKAGDISVYSAQGRNKMSSGSCYTSKHVRAQVARTKY